MSTTTKSGAESGQRHRAPVPPLRRFVGWLCPECRSTMPGRMPGDMACVGGGFPPGRGAPYHPPVVMDRLVVDNATGRLS